MRWRQTAWAALLAAGLGSWANAASLGEIHVSSRLGEPLQARVFVQATPDELRSLTVRLADPERYREAGILPPALLPQLSARLDRESGQTVVVLSTREPVRDPFVNVLLELSWNGGRLLREYAVLLDPPQYALPSAPTAPTAPRKTIAETVAPVSAQPTPQPAPATDAVMDSAHTVRRGETLSHLAARWSDGSPIEAVMYAIWKANPQAFIGGDPNLLMAGATVRRPEREQIAAIPPQELRQWRQAHLRPRAIAQARGGAQLAAIIDGSAVAGGQIVAREALAQPQAAVPQDRVEISPSRVEGSPAKDNAAAKATVANVPNEDVLALKGELQEAQERIAALEAQITRLTQLIELQSQTLAALSAGRLSVRADETALPAEAKEEARDRATGSAAGASADAAKAPQDAGAPIKAPSPPALPAEPNFIAFLLDNPLVLGGISAVLLIGASVLLWRRRSAARQEQERAGTVASAEPRTEFAQAAAAALAAASAAQAVPESSATPSRAGAQVSPENEGSVSVLGGDFTQVAFNALQADEGIDPVAEAEVLLAYDRDVQAEEILVDALKQTPTRIEIPLKLLEIYGRRQDTANFERHLEMVAQLTDRSGEAWQQALALKEKYFSVALPQSEKEEAAAVDAVAERSEPDISAATTAEVSAGPAAPEPMPEALEREPAMEETALSFELPETDSAASVQGPEPAVEVQKPDAEVAESASLLEEDILAFEQPADGVALSAHSEGAGETKEGHAAEPATKAAESAKEAELLDFTLDLELDSEPAPSPTKQEAPGATSATSSETGLREAEEATAAAEAASAPPATRETATAALAETSSLPELDWADATPADIAAPEAESLTATVTDLPTIDFDALSEQPSAGEGADDSRLLLARAYIDMEDYEGARELIEEVLRDGDEAAQAAARAMLAQLPQATA